MTWRTWARSSSCAEPTALSGGSLARAPIVPGPGYQLPFAQAIAASLAAAGAAAPVAAVGEITDARQAETIVGQGQADVVLLARAALADPHWWYRAARTLGHPMGWAGQYQRAQTTPLSQRARTGSPATGA